METPVLDKPEVLSVSQMTNTLGERISKELKEALATFKPEAPAAPMHQEVSDELQATLTKTLEELDKAGDSVVLMAKENGKHIFELMTSPEAQTRFEQTAIMGRGILDPIERAINPLIPNLPLGSLALGALGGLVIGEFVDGFTPPTQAGQINVTNVVVKGAAAIAFVAGGSALMSKQASLAAAAILTAQILADVLPLDAWIAKIRGVFQGGQGQTALEAQRWLNNASHQQPDPIGVTGHDIIGNIF